MPRKAGYYFYRGWWVTKMGVGSGSPIKLAKGKENKADAEVAFDKLKVARNENQGSVRVAPQLRVWELCDKYLDRVRAHLTTATLSDYNTELRKLVDGPRRSLQLERPWSEADRRFQDGHGGLRVRDVTHGIAEEFVNRLTEVYAPKTVNHFLIAANACWNWGLKSHYAADNPFRGIPELPTEDRQRTVRKDEFQSLLRGSDALFRQVLIFLRDTASRPGVVCQLRWGMVDWESKVLKLTRTKKSRTAKVKQPWLIPMVPLVENLLRWREKRKGQSTFVFVNEDGNAWTKDALGLRMRRLRERVGIGPDENGENLVLYSHRHTYLTRAATKVPGLMVTVLADHTDPRTTKRYLHVSPDHVLQAGLAAVGLNQNLRK